VSASRDKALKCDGTCCRFIVASGSRHFSCAPCDFDVCFRCAVQCCSATPPPPSASPPQPPPPPPPEPFFFEQEWALCCKCEKWRRLAPGAPVPAEDEDWECSMNLDPAHNTCDDEEEEDEDEEAAAMRARATAAAGEQADEEADEAALRERAASFAAGAAMEHPEEVTAADVGEERVAGSEDEKSEGEEDEAEDAFGDATFEALKKQMQQQQQLVSVDAESGEAASAAAAAAGPGAAGAADEEELRARRSTQPPSWADEPGYVSPGHEGFNAFARARMRRDGVPSNERVLPPQELQPARWVPHKLPKPRLQPYQETVAYLCRPEVLGSCPRMLIVHRTGSGKTATMLQVANAYFKDKRPKLLIFPTTAVCKNFYREVRNPAFPNRYAAYLDMVESGRAQLPQPKGHVHSTHGDARRGLELLGILRNGQVRDEFLRHPDHPP